MISGGALSILRWTSVCLAARLRSALLLTIPIDTFEINRERAIDYLNTRDNVYVFDGFAGVSPDYVTSALTAKYSCNSIVGSQVPH